MDVVLLDFCSIESSEIINAKVNQLNQLAKLSEIAKNILFKKALDDET